MSRDSIIYLDHQMKNGTKFEYFQIIIKNFRWNNYMQSEAINSWFNEITFCALDKTKRKEKINLLNWSTRLSNDFVKLTVKMM